MSAEGKYIGFINGIVAGISFGLIPLFSIPVIENGMDNTNILMYRFLFGCIAMLSVLLYKHVDLKLSLNEILRVSILSLFYIGTAITTLECYKYLSSGVATSLVFTDPVWCALIGIIFLHKPVSMKVSTAIILSVVGVMMLAGLFTEKSVFSPWGILWGLLSGLFYALYLISISNLKVRHIPSLKLTFYVFTIGLLFLFLYNLLNKENLQSISSGICWINLILLGLIPTALSNICVTISLKLIDSTIVAILGALEPVTAMIIGIIVLNDPFSVYNIVGTALILVSVGILTISRKKNSYPLNVAKVQITHIKSPLHFQMRRKNNTLDYQ